eukprot:2582834-Amphidinium_carterae.2
MMMMMRLMVTMTMMTYLPVAKVVSIYANMKIILTKNLNKKQDFVNSMTATIQAFDQDSGCLSVLTKTGKLLAVPLIEEVVEKAGRVQFYPVRLGYSSTVQKVEGQTLPHVTLFLDTPGCRAAAYVGMSRVRKDEDYLIAGDVTVRHFVPAM